MAEKFTPGEWEVKSRYTEWESTEKKIYSTQVIAPAAGYIISSIDTKDEKLLEMIQANAHLIAAAPEMYECVCDALTDLDMPEGMRNHFEAVLRKARGEE